MLFSFTTTKTLSEDEGDEYVHSIEATPTYSMLIDRVDELTKQLDKERQARLVLEAKFMELIEDSARTSSQCSSV
ncbi:hypothetical protein CJU90_2582 [Yarrowia sp. C11]|nr:hypothetical protein CKK34_4030 [Yarrowia sp. E02]KAG5369136.1 hypothetical protein CJU90_2582 [Yarrowia sp. C11]